MNQQEHLALLEKKLNQLLATAKAKNSDYCASSADAFQNFKYTEILGLCSAETGILVRMSDKMSRIASLLKKEAQVKDESIQDTLHDLALYSLLLSNFLEAKNEG